MAQAFTQLTPHLWVTQSDLFNTNSGCWIAGSDAVLVDPGITPAEIAGIARFVADLGARPQGIVLTHSHWDHILGPEQFPGVPVVAHTAYPPTVRDQAATILKELGDWMAQKQMVRPQPFVIPAPDVTFAERMPLPIGDLALDLDHAPGHAPDQLTLYEPASGTLWAADMLSDLEIPFVSHSLAAYRETLAMLAARDIRLLIPGHGYPTADAQEIQARLAGDRAYLDALHTRVGEVVAAGRPVDQAVAACADLPLRHPEANADPHRWNVESAYLELGGPGDPHRLGWSQWSA